MKKFSLLLAALFLSTVSLSAALKIQDVKSNSSYEKGETSGKNYIYDNDTKTYWRGKKANKNNWIMMDLGSDNDIKDIVIKERTSDGKYSAEEFSLGFSNDGKNFTEVKGKKIGKTLKVPANQKARYVKLTILKESDVPTKISEVQIIN